MTAGVRGTFVISGSQTETDGIPAASAGSLVVGSVWRWQGEAVCVDAPRDLLQLANGTSEARVRKRAARSVRRMLGPMAVGEAEVFALENEIGGDGFTLTDGRAAFHASVIDLPDRADSLIVFSDELPPAAVDLWVVDTALNQLQRQSRAQLPKGITCFASGTMIDTPRGPVAIEELAAGDLVATTDNGPQQLIWTGRLPISGLRLADCPELRPISVDGQYLSAGGGGRVLLSPDHRVLIRGHAADRLFLEPEVLVTAGDLLGLDGVEIDHSLEPLTYHQLLFAHHQVVMANGVACESFHPADVDLDGLIDSDRLHFIQAAPDIYRDPSLYGAHVRRVITRAEAALLKYGMEH